MSSLRELLPYLKPYWKAAVLAPLLMMLEVAMDLAQPRFLQQIVDIGIAQLQMSVVVRTGLAMVGVALIGAFGGVGCTVFAVKASMSAGADIRGALFRKVQSFSFGNLDGLKTGKLVTRLTNDVTQVQQMILILLRIMIRAPLLLVGSVLMAVITSPRLALILIVLVPILIVLLIWVVRKAHPLFATVQSRLDDVNTVMQENLAGVRVVKAFVRRKHENSRFAAVNEALMSKTMRAMRLMAIVMPLNMLLLNLGIVAVLWFGGVSVSEGAISVGQIMAFVNYLLRTLMSLMMVGMLLVRIARAMASADRIQEVLEQRPQVLNPRLVTSPSEGRGRIDFENVGFSYDGEPSDLVVQDACFVVEPGQTVAILGATGSGKSTLVQLIPRFYDVTMGRILVDGVDIREMDQQALRGLISVALQESILFSGTITDNIRYGRPSATEEEVTAAAEVAQADDFISRLPDRYESRVGQRGVNLSGGQKQRLAIARAVAMNPSILILDDCTSAVDVETESRIQDAIGEKMKNTTCIMVAQRISSVLTADKILVLSGGRIAGEGDHKSLLAGNTLYKEIYNSQLGQGVRNHV